MRVNCRIYLHPFQYCSHFPYSIEVDYFIAGIGSYKDGTIVLAYNADEIDPNAPIDDNDDAIRECPRPEIRLLDASFTEVACDMLSIGGYQVCQPSDYSLGRRVVLNVCVVSNLNMLEIPNALVTLPEDSTFYVLSPKDLIVGRPRDSTDRVDWLLERDRLEDALGVLEEESSAEGRARFREVGQAHMQRLMDEGRSSIISGFALTCLH